VPNNPAVETFQGFAIRKDDEGFHWNYDGYFETLEECRDSIRDWNASEWPEDREDTPCLPDPWWMTR
jgi:hypothetical protein